MFKGPDITKQSTFEVIDMTACCSAGALVVVHDSCDESLIARKSRISLSG